MNTTLSKQRLPESAGPQPACPQAVTAATWAAGKLDAAAQLAYRQHLAHCACCTAELARLQETVAQLRSAPFDMAQPSPDLTDRIMAALPPQAFRVTRCTRMLAFVRRHRVAAAAAAAVLATGLSLWQLAGRQPAANGRAADAGCAWLARQQEVDGSWDPVKSGGTALYRPALTALAALALMREPKPEAKAIASALTAIQQMQQADGAFGADPAGRMYNHALASWALLTAYQQGHHPELKPALDQAVAFIRARQQATGGWGYLAISGEPANTAITAWQVQILARARQAGWDDAGGHLRKGLNWLRQCATDNGQFGYTATPGDASATPTLNAMGAYTLLTAGSARPDLVQVASSAMAHLRSAPSTDATPESDLYRAFFTVIAWDAAGDHQHADRIRASLYGQRETRGVNQGSWTPADNWSKVGGRLYTTSLAVLTLQSRTAQKM